MPSLRNQSSVDPHRRIYVKLLHMNQPFGPTTLIKKGTKNGAPPQRYYLNVCNGILKMRGGHAGNFYVARNSDVRIQASRIRIRIRIKTHRIRIQLNPNPLLFLNPNPNPNPTALNPNPDSNPAGQRKVPGVSKASLCKISRGVIGTRNLNSGSDSESTLFFMNPNPDSYLLALNPNLNPNPAQKALNPDSNPNPDSDSHITGSEGEYM